jgi:RNA-directed DNA polymerase
MPGPEDKSLAISKLLVREAWRQVKANKGAPGVDGQDRDEFEADLADNLYKIWNRMSSGSYLPPAVRAVELPKPHGGGSGCRVCRRSRTGSRDGRGHAPGGTGGPSVPA